MGFEKVSSLVRMVSGSLATSAMLLVGSYDLGSPCNGEGSGSHGQIVQAGEGKGGHGYTTQDLGYGLGPLMGSGSGSHG